MASATVANVLRRRPNIGQVALIDDYKGLELFGQHRMELDDVRKKLGELRVLPVVEGPNDVIALDHLDIPSLGLCGNRVTAEQARQLAAYAQALGIPIGLMLDNDTEGETGARQSLPVLAEHWSVRLIWSSSMYDGQFRERQPESLTKDECQQILRTSSH